MNKINKLLDSDENIIFQTTKHWIIFTRGIAWLIFSIIISQQNLPIGSIDLIRHVSLATYAIAAVFLVRALLNMLFSNYVITDKRVIIRDGFFLKNSADVDIAKISSIESSQSFIAQLFGYGSLMINIYGDSINFNHVSRVEKFREAFLNRPQPWKNSYYYSSYYQQPVSPGICEAMKSLHKSLTIT